MKTFNYRHSAMELLSTKELNIINNPQSLKNKLFSKRKLITVVCAAFNAEKSISKMIESVIHQSLDFEKIELIIVDDGSTDNTASIIRNFSKKLSKYILGYPQPKYRNSRHSEEYWH